MSNFHRFITAHACNTLHIGVQMIFIAWLAVGLLKLQPAQVGWVQSAVLLPNILVLLWVGRWVDSSNPVKLAALANVLLVLVHMGFLLSVLHMGVQLQALMIYAVALGALNALIQNAREALVGALSAPHHLQKSVSTVTFVQFACQAGGVGVAAGTEWFGVELLIGLQMALCVVAAGFYMSFHAEINTATPGPAVKILANPMLRSVVAIVAFNGLMHLGMFVVLLPLLAVHYLGYSVSSYAFLQLVFIAGSMVVSLKLMYSAPVEKPGQHMVFALLYSGVIGLALSAGPTPFGLYALIFCWGAVAGSSANHCRVIVQQLTPGASRGRVMAVYQVALFGAAPIGALLGGYLVQIGGIHLPLTVISYSSIGLFVVFLLDKAVWQYASGETSNKAL